MPVHSTSYWTIESGNWTVEPDGGSAVLVPPDESADLRLITCDFDSGLNQQQLLDWGRQRVPAGIPVNEVKCGQFSGVTYELMDCDGVFWREWLLSLAELVLLVSYCCEQGDGKRHRTEVDRMLSTLTDNRA
jgi:hypothetical protein